MSGLGGGAFRFRLQYLLETVTRSAAQAAEVIGWERPLRPNFPIYEGHDGRVLYYARPTGFDSHMALVGVLLRIA